MRPGRVLLLILLGGLLVRVVYLGEVIRLPFFQDPVGDSALHIQRAHEIIRGTWIGDSPFFYGGILYPYLIAVSLTVFGANLYPLCLAQALAGCALAWVLHRICLEGSGDIRSRRGAGLAAAAMAVLYGPLAFLEADLIMISWTLLAMMCAAWLLLRRREPACSPGTAAGCLLAGILLGLAASERPNLVLLVPVAAAWIGWFAPRPGRLLKAAMVLAGGGAVIAGVAWMNHAASSRWVLLTTSSGINFYIGNNPAARGTFEEPWSGSDPAFAARYTDLEDSSLRMARRLSGKPLDAVAASRYWFGRGVGYLADHPAGAAWLYLRKLGLFWNAAEIPNHLDYAFMRSLAPALWLMPLGFWLAGPLGLYGALSPSAARAILGRPATALLALFVLVPMASVLPFFVADRYRVVIVPALIVLAATGLIDLASRLSTPALRAGGLARAGAVIIAMGLTCIPLADFDRSRDHWMLAQAYKKQGDLPSAEAEYRRALAESPGNAPVYNNLGVVLGMSGDDAGAEAAYRRALEIEPSLARPRRNLGLLLTRQGRMEEAFAHLLAAEAVDGSDLDVAAALAFIYMSRGEKEPAVERARKVLDGRPGDRTALSVLEAAGGGAIPPARP